jgi:hypothetical protein
VVVVSGQTTVVRYEIRKNGRLIARFHEGSGGRDGKPLTATTMLEEYEDYVRHEMFKRFGWNQSSMTPSQLIREIAKFTLVKEIVVL